MKPYGNLDQMVKDTQDAVENAHKARSKYVKPLPAHSADIFQRALQKVNQYLGNNPLQNTAVYSQFYDSPGGVVKLRDGKSHVLLSSDAAYLTPDRGHVLAFARNNPGKNFNVESWLENVMIHELGHLILEERIEPAIRIAHYDFNPQGLPLEMDEAYAFSFADSMTDMVSPLPELKFHYIRDGLDFQKTIEAYNDLRQRISQSGVSLLFDPTGLNEIFNKHAPKPKRFHVTIANTLMRGMRDGLKYATRGPLK